MLIHESFDRTLRKYSIAAKTLAKLANVSEGHISQFRNGRGGAVAHTKLEELLDVMEQLAPGSRPYFYLLLAAESSECLDFDILVQSLDEVQLGKLIAAIGRRVSSQAGQSSQKFCKSAEQVVA